MYAVSTLMDPPVLVNAATGEQMTILESSNRSGVAAFAQQGDFIFLGDNKGAIYIVHTDSLKEKGKFQIKGSAMIKSIVFDSSGDHMIVNSSDKTLRIFSHSESEHSVWEQTTEIADSINRLQWKCTCFSRDSDYILAGTAELKEHNIYFYMKGYADIVKVLEGPKEGLMDVCVCLIGYRRFLLSLCANICW